MRAQRLVSIHAANALIWCGALPVLSCFIVNPNEKSQRNEICVLPCRPQLRTNINRTLEKSQTNAISVTICALVEVPWGHL